MVLMTCAAVQLSCTFSTAECAFVLLGKKKVTQCSIFCFLIARLAAVVAGRGVAVARVQLPPLTRRHC
jgi:hypothetical protein